MRSKLLFLFSILFLFLSILTEWFAIPGFKTSASDYVAFTSKFQIYFKIIIALLILFILFKRFLIFENKKTILVYWATLFIVLCYPHFVMIYDGKNALKATLLTKQSWMQVREIERNFSSIQTNWKLNYEKYRIPTDFDTIQIVVPDRDFIHFQNIESAVITSAGYSTEFFEFVKVGWILGIIGCVLLIFSAYIRDGTIFFHNFKFIVIMVFIFGTMIITPNMVGSYFFYQGNVFKSMGLYDKALLKYENAKKIFPLLNYNSSYHNSLGELLFRRGQKDTWQYYIYSGDDKLKRSKLESALSDYKRAFEISFDHPIAKLKLILLLINRANLYYNNAQYDSAMILWKQVTELDATNIIGQFGLMITGLHTGDYGVSFAAADSLIALQNFFQIKRVTIVSQAYLHKGLQEYKKGNLQRAFDYYTLSINPGKW